MIFDIWNIIFILLGSFLIAIVCLSFIKYVILSNLIVLQIYRYRRYLINRSNLLNQELEEATELI